MINKVIVFGDSFMYGSESWQHDFEQEKFVQDAGEAIGRFPLVLDKDGVPDPPFQPQEYADYTEFSDRVHGEQANPNHPNYYSIGGILSKHLEVEQFNYASGGHSNNIILYDVIKNLDNIDSNSLVICGISQPERRSYYGIHTSNGKTGTYTNCWNPVVSRPEYQKWKQLNLTFGDDSTAHAITTLSYVKTIKQLINQKGCNNLFFIDPFHQFCPNKYSPNSILDYIYTELSAQELFEDENLVENYKHGDLVKFLKQQFMDLFLIGISQVFEDVTAEGNPIQCIGGHYSRYTYEKYVEQIILPKLDK